MTVTVFVGSLLGAMALGMPIAYALLVCGLALMAFMAATGALPAFDSQILAQRFVDGAAEHEIAAEDFHRLADSRADDWLTETANGPAQRRLPIVGTVLRAFENLAGQQQGESRGIDE